MNVPATARNSADITRWEAGPAAPCNADEAAAAWLREPGLLTERLRALCDGCPGLVVVAQHAVTLPADALPILAVEAREGHCREVELTCDGAAWVFAQTLIPAATMDRHPWLGALGDSALGARLAAVPGIERGPLEFAALAPGHPLYERCLRDCEQRPARLWARRSWFSLAGDRLLVQEVFLPGSLA